MKKAIYILFAFSAFLFASCEKEAQTDIDGLKGNEQIITFKASIVMPAATKASLSNLDIQWASGDYIGIATDNRAKIVAYPVVPDPNNPSQCSVSVVAVPGATAYYAIFKGSLGAGGDTSKESAANDFSGITFDTTTKTFSGLSVGNQQVASGSLSSHLWYSNGYPLAMAGKANGTSLVMRPCLALVKLQIHSDSVPSSYYYNTETYTSSSNIDHDHSYSAVRGFNLYEIGASTIYSSGAYTVQVANDGTLTTTATGNNEYRQISIAEKLTADTDYLMCLIPGGSISGFHIDFLGYSDNTPTLSWDTVYSMDLNASTSVLPGDFFDLGKLNPLEAKKNKNENDDDAIDAAAATYDPAIDIDGDMDEWSSIPAAKLVSASGPSQDYQEFKVTYDEFYIYFYTKRNLARQNEWPFYIWYEIDTNSDGTYEKRFYFYPYSKQDNNLVFNSTPTSSEILNLTLSSAEHTGTGYVEFETSVPRSELGISKGNVLKFRSTMNKVDTGATLTISSSLTINN